MICPKCGHERTPEENQFFPETDCPACGINYAKFTLSQKLGTLPPAAPRQPAIKSEKLAPTMAGRPDKIEITGINIPFWNMVNLIFAIAIASIPALILVNFVIFGIWAGLFAAFGIAFLRH